jgi:hypothetical protein
MAGKLSVARMKALLSGNSMTSVSTSGDSTVGSGLVLSDIGTVAAAGGPTIADAAAITTHVTIVTAADGTKGVKLPTGATTGEVYVVSNSAAAALKIYAADETLNGVTAGTALTIAANKGAICVKSGAATWAVIFA